ncbi:PQQ-binding-like beta-propeller repeat protein, partial [candidate division KSB1 bacterium]|nr:PQQ-binding-like beta-propeller repeat protein [candidate division KSB1 bacterium]
MQKKNIFTCLIVLCISSSLPAAQPRLKWQFEAESQLYAPPLVADIHPKPGKEVILSDSEVRKLRCIDANGNQIWESGADWKKRVTTAAALSRNALPGIPALLIGNDDGTLTCMNAATGKRIWQRQAGSIQWGNAIWTDINGDGRDEALAGTMNEGIIAFDARGKRMWSFGEKQFGRKPLIESPIAAADLDADGKHEIIAVEHAGPICLNGNGTLRWQCRTGDEFKSAPVIADADRDGKPEVYCASFEDAALHCIDAAQGNLIWRTPLMGSVDVYSGSCLAVGDINQDGFAEILSADDLGYLYCLNYQGELLWIFPTEKRVHAAAALGDVDGDGEIEVLLASGDHGLYCLDSDGFLEWIVRADLRLIYSPTITDIDEDGKTDILFCGSDRTLRCLTLDTRHQPERMPWASRRFDIAQSGSAFGTHIPDPAAKFAETKPLFLYG